MAQKRAAIALTLALAAPTVPRGCGSAAVRHEVAPEPECESHEMVYGRCVGVPREALCGRDPCIGHAACARVLPITRQDELDSALTSARAGDCIALAAGDWGDVPLPGGVSLLGSGADSVRVRSVTLGQGVDATVRGITAQTGGISLAGATNARIEAVRVDRSEGDGIAVDDASAVEISRSEVLSAGRVGIAVSGGGVVTLLSSIVARAGGGGIWGTCEKGCDCDAPGRIEVDTTLVADNRLVGIDATGVDVIASRVVITGTKPDLSFEGGFGLVASECADVVFRESTVRSSAGPGILVDGASARIGQDGQDGQGTVELSDVGGGVWVQHVSAAKEQEVRLERVSIRRSRGVGVLISGHSSDVYVRDVLIADTVTATVPILTDGVSAGAVEVGDGFMWLDRSFADIDGLTIESSPRASFLIDGEVAAGSRIASVHLTGADAGETIVQQRCPSWGSSPELGQEMPPLERTEEQIYPVPWE